MLPTPPTADVATLDLAREGDREAISELWRIYQPQLLRVLHSRGRGAVDDVASQVWIDVGRSLARFSGDGTDFRRWLFTIARNRSIDSARRRGSRELTLDTVDESAQAHFDDFESVGSLERALAILQDLPSDQAEAVMLRVVHDMSVVDVAEVMDKSEGNVRVLVHRGLKQLHRMLDAQQIEARCNAEALADVHGI